MRSLAAGYRKSGPDSVRGESLARRLADGLSAENPREIEAFDSWQRSESFGPTTACAGTRVYSSAIDYSNPVECGTEARIDGIAYAQPDGADWDGGVLVANGDYGDGWGTADTTPPTVDSAPGRPNIVYTIPDLDDRRPPPPARTSCRPCGAWTGRTPPADQRERQRDVPGLLARWQVRAVHLPPAGRRFSGEDGDAARQPHHRGDTLINRASQPSWQPVG